MIILFLIILLIVIAGVFVMWASRLPGGLTLDLGNGTLYEFELVWALLAILLVGAAMALYGPVAGAPSLDDLAGRLAA